MSKPDARLAALLGLVLAAATMTACDDSPLSPTVTFRQVASGTMSQFDQPQTLVIRDQPAWQDVLDRIQPAAPPDPVNFSSEMLVGVFLGGRPTAGYSVRVDRIARSDGTLRLVATEVAPHPTCLTAQVLTQPFTVVAVPTAQDVEIGLQRQVGPPCS